ncbi:MAG: hypothetical protein M3P22_02375 [bacterium]|nr:hypothetical protein [bacterium]
MENNNTPKETELNKKNPNIETLSNDILNMVERYDAGVVHSIIKDEEEREMLRTNFSPTSKRNKTFIILGILFILLAIALLYLFFYFQNKKQIVEVTTPFKPLIYTDQYQLVPIDKLNTQEFKNSILHSVGNSDFLKDELVAFYLTENQKTINTMRFFALLESNLDTETIAHFNPSFMLGTVEDLNKSIFILWKVDNFAGVFVGLQNWENKMFYDLHYLFNITLDKDNSYLLTKSFEDGVIQNKNARILYDNKGRIVMAYIFLDDTSILLTNNNNTAKEVLLRFYASSLKK